MKKYFLHNGTENSGPFTLEELKEKKIVRETPVWYEGIEDWTVAGEIAALGSLFVAVPPPIKKTIPSSLPEPHAAIDAESTAILGLPKKTVYVVTGILVVLLVGTFILSNLQENNNAATDQKNKKTEIENEQFTIQQKEIEAQKILLEEQERLETERVAKERKQNVVNKQLKIKALLTEYAANLAEEEKKMDTASGFKLFRTTAERNEEISLIQNDIDYWKEAIRKLETQATALQLELEVINSLPVR
jgi:predicted transcriptional regulator